MRARGASLRTIASELGVALSSVSVWVREVERPVDLLVRIGASPAWRGRTRRLPVWDAREVRRCYLCERLLPEVAFARAAGARQYRCRRCCRDYFRTRGDLHRSQSGEALRRRRLRAKAHVLGYLAAHPCTDCGERDPLVLEFDHLEEKTAAVSVLAHEGVSLSRLDTEIALCEVVCVCCHRRRTSARRGEPALVRHPGRARNAAYVRSLLVHGGCVDCGERDPLVLDFDHVGYKTSNVSRLVTRGSSLSRLQAEIGQCEIRCANCHRRQTAERGMHFRFRAA